MSGDPHRTYQLLIEVPCAVEVTVGKLGGFVMNDDKGAEPWCLRPCHGAYHPQPFCIMVACNVFCSFTVEWLESTLSHIGAPALSRMSV